MFKPGMDEVGFLDFSFLGLCLYSVCEQDSEPTQEWST
jgi:hypothetical protein